MPLKGTGIVSAAIASVAFCHALMAECETERARVDRVRGPVASLRNQVSDCVRIHRNDPGWESGYFPVACHGLSEARTAAERAAIPAERALAACLAGSQQAAAQPQNQMARAQQLVAVTAKLFSMLFPPKPRRANVGAPPLAPPGTSPAPAEAETSLDQAQIARDAAARRTALEAQQAAMRAQQIREERDQAVQSVKDRQDAWNRQQGLTSDSAKPRVTARDELWRQQQLADSVQREEARQTIKPLLDIDLDEKFGELLQAVEKASGMEAPDPVNDAIDAVMDETLGEVGKIPPLKQFFDSARQKLVNGLRESVGGVLCAPSPSELSGTQDVDEAYTTFWSGVCGGWVGRPLSPSGVYGYLNEEVVEKFNGFFNRVATNFGLMP